MNKALKRMVDIFISGSALLVLLPVFALIAMTMALKIIRLTLRIQEKKWEFHLQDFVS